MRFGEDRRHLSLVLLHAGPRPADVQIAGRFQQLGLASALIDIDDERAILSLTGPRAVVLNRVYASTIFDRPDAIGRTLQMLPRLQQQGVTLLNSLTASRADYSKLYAAQLMRSVGIPTPGTALRDPSVLPDSFPVVVKPDTGGFGRSLNLIRSAREWSALARGRQAASPWVVQEFVPTTEDHDYRVTVLFGRVVVCVTRTLLDGWIGSIGRGSAATLCDEVPADVENLAVRASQAVDAKINGVDIKRGPSDTVVIENNPTPNFGLEAWAHFGVDIVGLLCDAVTTWLDAQHLR